MSLTVALGITMIVGCVLMVFRIDRTNAGAATAGALISIAAGILAAEWIGAGWVQSLTIGIFAASALLFLVLGMSVHWRRSGKARE